MIRGTGVNVLKSSSKYIIENRIINKILSR